MLWPMAITDYLRRTDGVPAASWRRANSWWTHIYREPTQVPRDYYLFIGVNYDCLLACFRLLIATPAQQDYNLSGIRDI
jgi:hypothetical protein